MLVFVRNVFSVMRAVPKPSQLWGYHVRDEPLSGQYECLLAIESEDGGLDFPRQ